MYSKGQTESGDALSFKKLFLSCVMGAAIALAAALVLMLLTALIAYPTADPMGFVPAGYGIFLLCAFLCGFISAKKAGGKALFCGAIGGAVYLAVAVSVSMLLVQEDMGARRMVLLISAFAVAVVGAALTISGGGKGARRPTGHAKAKLKKRK